MSYTRSTFVSLAAFVYVPQSCERGPTVDCPPIPKFCLDFLLKSETYSKEHPPTASFANRDFPLSMKPEHVVYIHYKVQIMLLRSGLHQPMMSRTICTALSAQQYTILIARMSAHPPLFEPKVRCTAHGPFFARLRYMYMCTEFCLTRQKIFLINQYHSQSWVSLWL